MIDSLQEQDREELVKFLKEDSILRMIDDDRIIYGLSLSLEEINCGPGHVVFREGDAGDGLYIIKRGSVEVRRADMAAPIAYLTAGECFGEMSLIHGGPRTATIRVPEEALILRLSKSASLDLQTKFPRLAEELNRLAQKRDVGEAFVAPGLQGNTAFFDLPTVIQAVAASRQSGTLNIFATPNKPSAKLLFYQGHLVSADFRHLNGEAAVFELLSSQDSADFAFARCSDQDIDAAQRQTAIRAIERLLIEGSRRADELAKLTDLIGGAAMTFSTAIPELKAQDLMAESRALAPKVWKLITLDLTVEEMFPLINGDRYTVLHILSELLSQKQINKVAVLLVDEDPGAAGSGKANRASTAEVNLRQLVKQSTKLSTTLYALNMVAANLSSIVSTDIVQTCLDEALHEAVKKYPQMSCLKIHRGGKTLDVRGATPEFSARSDSTLALTFFTKRFLQLMGAMVYEKPTPSVQNRGS